MPEKDNPYHAHINLPKGIKRDEKIAYSKELAVNSEWTLKFNKRG